MRDDLKAAVRSLRTSPSFTIVALLVLVLGIGATTAVFSVVDAVVLRGLPFDEHDRLVAVGERRPTPRSARPPRDPQALGYIAPQNYVDWAGQQQVFEMMAAIDTRAFTLREPAAPPEDVRGQRVTAGFFDVLRVKPAIGRAFTTEHEVEGHHRVVVVSHQLWQRRFGGDPSLVGRALPLDGETYEVVGIMPPDFSYPVAAARATELWTPYVVPAAQRIRHPNELTLYLQCIARLRPGVSIREAQAQMDQVAASLAAAHPAWNGDTTIGVRPLYDHLIEAATRSWMLMLLAAVGIVLLIACANVASLLLTRATTRHREMSVRAALGASRARLLRQLLVESVVLAACGTAASLVMAAWGVEVLRGAMPDGVPRVSSIAVDLRVLCAAAGLSLITALLFGVAPAVQASRIDLTAALKEGGRGAARGGRHGLRRMLVIGEIALALVLLVGAGLFLGSFIALMRVDPGFDPARVLTASLSPGPAAPGEDRAAVFGRIVERIEQNPGVLHAAIVSGGMPFGSFVRKEFIEVEGRPLERDRIIDARIVSREYHRTLGIPLRTGRLFDRTDRPGSGPVAIVNEALVWKFFGGENPVGQRARIGGASRTIVGVVGDVHQNSLEIPPSAEAYLPLGHAPVSSGELVVKTSGDPEALIGAVRAATLVELPAVPLRTIRTMESLLSSRVAQRRLNMLLLGLFGVLGLVIAAAGVYGVVAHTVSQRTREIGVRMALGATRGGIVRMVLAQASLMIGSGLVLGALAAWQAASLADAFLYKHRGDDPRMFVAAALLLALAGLLATLVPAHRAASIAPTEALRAE